MGQYVTGYLPDGLDDIESDEDNKNGETLKTNGGGDDSKDSDDFVHLPVQENLLDVKNILRLFKPGGVTLDELSCEASAGGGSDQSNAGSPSNGGLESQGDATYTDSSKLPVMKNGTTTNGDDCVLQNGNTVELTDSLVHIKRSENYPIKSTVKDDPTLEVPFKTLQGEYVEYLGRITGGVIALSNYRLFILPEGKDSFVNIPTGLIDGVEYREIFHITIVCKDARTIRCTFPVNENCLEWYKRIMNAIKTPKILSQTFAFAFYAWTWDAISKNTIDGVSTAAALVTPYNKGKTRELFDREVRRLGFDLKTSWKITYINEGFKTCGSYPEYHITASSLSEEEMSKIANFRSSHRFPSVVWSQPEVGWFGSRCSEDENFPRAILAACAANPGSAALSPTESSDNGLTPAYEENVKVTNGSGEGDDTKPGSVVGEDSVLNSNQRTMLIIDARSYTAAIANRAKGGGCECQDYYPSCEILFMNLANIHAIRKSFISLRTQCGAPPETTGWLVNLENTKWLQNISGLLCAAMVVVKAIDVEQRPVLVHCSDGWDRTPQIVSLSELLLDPFYRTLQGFRILLEREWLSFGHRFADRCNQGLSVDDPNERCPVFLQWLDCVHQLIKQFPLAFEFNEAYLVKLAQHSYSGLFGDFLCNNIKQREEEKLYCHTLSVWSLLNPHNSMFINQFYREGSTEQVLRPQCNVQNLELWRAVYLTDHSAGDVLPPLPSSSFSSSDGCSPHEDIPLSKARSCDDLSKLLESALSVRFTLGDSAAPLSRRLSDSDVTGSSGATSVIDTKSAIAAELGCMPAASEKPSAANETADHCRSSRETLIAVPLEEGLVSEEGRGMEESQRGDESSETITDPLESQFPDSQCMQDSTQEETIDKEQEMPESSIGAEQDEVQDPFSSFMPHNGLHPDHFSSHTSCPICNSETVSNITSNIPQQSVRQAVRASCNKCTSRRSQPPAASLRLETGVALQLASGQTTGGAVESESTSTCQASVPSTCTSTPLDDARMLSLWYSDSEGSTKVGYRMDWDGLIAYVDPVQQRMLQIQSENAQQVRQLKERSQQLERQLESARAVIARFAAANQLSGAAYNGLGLISTLDNGKDEAASTDSGSGCDGASNYPSSDSSWEPLDEREAQMTLWTPDHAVTHCAGCEQEFWLACRKHHCRNCGKVFCHKCSSLSMPIPQQNLNDSVRVCLVCFKDADTR